MRFATVCSGIEAASAAWVPLGWEPVFYSEIDPHPCHVLAHRLGASRPRFMPDPDERGVGALERRARRNAIKAVASLPEAGAIPNLGDMTQFKEWPDYAIDLLAGGTPCQSFSVAGLRAGLDDPRGNLLLTYLAIAARYRPRWVVWENVPGVLSIDDGRAFAALLGGLAELGYGWAYRVLDAQHCRAFGLPFAVPQRRRRVFVVGYLGDWRRAAAVLFDGASLRGDSPPRREAGQRVAGSIVASAARRGGVDDRGEGTGNLIPEVSPTLLSMGNKTGGNRYPGTDVDSVESLIPVGGGPEGGTISGAVSSKWAKGSGGPAGDELYNMVAEPVPFDTTQITHPENPSNPQPGDPAGSMPAAGHAPAIAYNITPSNSNKDYNAREARYAQAITTDAGKPPSARGGTVIAFHASQDPDVSGDVTHPLGRNQGQEVGVLIRQPTIWRVRRLTPRECERLMGFPDDFTDVPWRGATGSPDGPRYKELGNSWAVNVAQVIGERIAIADQT